MRTNLFDKPVNSAIDVFLTVGFIDSVSSVPMCVQRLIIQLSS